MSTTIERTRSIRATAPLAAWRTVDILTIAFLGAALGVAFWGWGVFDRRIRELKRLRSQLQALRDCCEGERSAAECGILQGLGAEFAFLLLGYSVYGLGAAIFAGAMAAPLEAVYEWFVYWTDWGWGYKIAYLFILTAAGAFIAGTLGWLITRALAAAGALNAFPPGQELRESRSV